MASPLVGGLRYDAAAESIRIIAADLASKYGVDNPLASVEFEKTHLETVDRGSSALFQARLIEQQLALLSLMASILDKITPAG